MFNNLLMALQHKKPIVTLLFVASALLTTGAQFFLPTPYDVLTGRLAGGDSLLYLTLPTFSHAPEFLAAHLLVNLLVFLLFGSVTELLIGSRRFALITTVTFTLSLLLSYLRGIDTMHGISGVCWGYHGFSLFVLILYWERNRFRFWRDPLVYLFLGLFAFNFIGIPALEMLVQRQRFMANFGQYIHLASVVGALPFLLLWRRQIERNFVAMIEQQPLHHPHFTLIPLVAIGVLLLLNAVGTIDAIRTTIEHVRSTVSVEYTLDPPTGTPIAEVGEIITVIFNVDMVADSQELTQHSITYTSDPLPEMTECWLEPRRMEISLSRALTADESLHLVYRVMQKTEENIPLEVPVQIAYQ